ncbi:MAG: hypothetical protein HC798_04400 [Polaribacter sp.]|nr:hypothetical protein [Polaribacter sp.]
MNFFKKRSKQFFDSSEQSLFKLTSEQEASILKGREQIKDGKFSTNDSVISEMNEWISKE